MNAHDLVYPTPAIHPPTAMGTHPGALPWSATRFVADWTEMSFVHFSLPPEVLAPHTSYPPDVRHGLAFVSLVFFRLGRMRPPGTGWPGRILFRPISDHYFLNFRAYVRGPAGPGIEFLSEWIPNPLALRLGPLTYGLPYRFGDFRWTKNSEDDRGELNVSDRKGNSHLSLSLPTPTRPLACARADSEADFLLERYVAYTRHRGVRRFFRVSHEPWRFARTTVPPPCTDLVTREFPWFAEAKYHSAHFSPGVWNVRMSRPHKISERTSSSFIKPLSS